MNSNDDAKERIMEAVSTALDQRIRPNELERKLEQEYGFSTSTVKEALKVLIDDGELAFTYRDPCSYVEIPITESHHAARPMKVIQDTGGEYWICDADVDPTRNPGEQGCWRCGDLPFTRDD